MPMRSWTGAVCPPSLPLLFVALLLLPIAPVLAVCPDCDGDGYDDRVDCDDSQPSVHPGAPEQCDSRDNDCDTFVDEDLVQACSTNCGAGTSTCRGGMFYECTAKPCCDQTIGPSQPTTTICPLASFGGQVICVLPGAYPIDPGCVIRATLVSTGGAAVTTLTGDFVSDSPRIQGFTMTGHPTTPDLHFAGDWLDNVMNAGLYSSAGSRAQIAGNRVTGDLRANYAYSVRDNVVDGGILTIETESDVPRYIDAVGNTVLNGGIHSNWSAIVERNQVSGPAGILFTNGRDVRITGNLVEGADVGISVLTHPQGSSRYLVGRNKVLNPGLTGIRISLGVPQDRLQVYDNLIVSPSPAPPADPTSAGVALDVTSNISFFPTLLDLTANTIVGHRTGVDLSCLFCPTMQVGLTSNIIAFNSTAGVHGNPLQPITAASNDVYGSLSNWLGIPDPTGTNGNFADDPLFVDGAGGDFHLLASSTCLETGVPHTCSRDLEGRPRAIDGNLDTIPVPDMGALESDPEVGPLRYLYDPLRLEWSSYPYAMSGYDIYGGLISVLGTTGNYTQLPPVCHWPSSDYEVPDAVPLGDALFHHVAPVGAVPGGIGYDSHGNARPLLTPCP